MTSASLCLCVLFIRSVGFTIRENVVPVFLSRISNADIQCVAIANPDELWNCSRVFPAQLPIWKTENDRLAQVIWRKCGTKPMELLNEINGIVQRNQWNRSTKSMGLLKKTGRLITLRRQNNWRKMAGLFSHLPAALHKYTWIDTNESWMEGIQLPHVWGVWEFGSLGVWTIRLSCSILPIELLSRLQRLKAAKTPKLPNSQRHAELELTMLLPFL